MKMPSYSDVLKALAESAERQGRQATALLFTNLRQKLLTDGQPVKCANCDVVASESTPLQVGWGLSLYCSEACERDRASRLRSNLPGAIPVPYGTPGHSVLPKSVADAIQARWGHKWSVKR